MALFPSESPALLVFRIPSEPHSVRAADHETNCLPQLFSTPHQPVSFYSPCNFIPLVFQAASARSESLALFFLPLLFFDLDSMQSSSSSLAHPSPANAPLCFRFFFTLCVGRMTVVVSRGLHLVLPGLVSSDSSPSAERLPSCNGPPIPLVLNLVRFL